MKTIERVKEFLSTIVKYKERYSRSDVETAESLLDSLFADEVSEAFNLSIKQNRDKFKNVLDCNHALDFVVVAKNDERCAEFLNHNLDKTYELMYIVKDAIEKYEGEDKND